MKIKYVEQYSTCIFFTRIVSYTLNEGAKDELIEKIMDKLMPLQCKYNFFEDHGKATKLSVFLEKKLVSISWIFRLPFLTPLWVANPRKMYQKWCEAWDGYFTDEEKREIIDVDIANGEERAFWGRTLWTLMNMQKRYVPVLFEIDYLIRHSFCEKD